MNLGHFEAGWNGAGETIRQTPDLMYPSADVDGLRMPQNRPELTEADAPGQVLLFRRRRMSRPPRRAAGDPMDPTNESVDDLAQYEQDEEIDYRHRMLMNVIAVAICMMLVGAGVWIADTIAEMQRDQDCVLQGRANCAPIEISHTHRQ